MIRWRLLWGRAKVKIMNFLKLRKILSKKMKLENRLADLVGVSFAGRLLIITAKNKDNQYVLISVNRKIMTIKSSWKKP